MKTKIALTTVLTLSFFIISLFAVSASQALKPRRERPMDEPPPDLTIAAIGLNDQCQVVVTVKNIGHGMVPDYVWTAHKPESSSVYISKDGKGWGGGTIWGFDPGKNLQAPGGKAVYTSTLKVTGSAVIVATVDHTKQVLETNEGNNKKKEKLVCKTPVAEKDLKVKIRRCPRNVSPGQELGSKFKVMGKSTFPGALSDVAVDIILSSNRHYKSPAPYATYSPNYSEDVLLKGGREHISFSGPGTVTVKLNGTNTIPADTPPGIYYLGAVIDTGNKVSESNERNNKSFCKIRVR
jgi:hypothetical protein